MSNEPGFHNRHTVLAAKIRNLLCDLGLSTYDEVAPKIEYWVEYVLAEQFMTTSDLVEQVSTVAWSYRLTNSHISRFLKEFRDAPHRSEQARSFVDGLCLYVIRWFAVASAEEIWEDWSRGLVSNGGVPGFLRAAGFVGHLIECGLLSRELVQRHIIKPLTNHYYNQDNFGKQAIKANAIYMLFVAAGNTLLQGLLEPEDVQVCFEKLQTWVTLGYIKRLDIFNAAMLSGFRELHAAWLQRKEEEETRNPTATEVILRGIVPPSILQDVEYPSERFANIPNTAVSSPTLSISTISDLTPTELGEDIEDSCGEQVTIPHDTFYFEDGSVEVVCGHTLFRVHSSTISFSSPKLQDMLSRPALLQAPKPEGYPRITFKDTPQDFSVLLKMIYTPGFPVWGKVPEFTTFASLLRMTTKYGFSDVRGQLLESIKGAYPTKWEYFRTAKVLGEGIFGSPKPHPNAVLNLFMEQGIKFALPFAAYRAGMAGLSSLTSDKPGTVLPRLALASIMHGMETIRGEVARLAYSAVCIVRLEDCRDEACAVNKAIKIPDKRLEMFNQIYDVMVRESKGGVLSSDISLGHIACVRCAKTPEESYRFWRKVIWEGLPQTFRVGKSWEEV